MKKKLNIFEISLVLSSFLFLIASSYQKYIVFSIFVLFVIFFLIKNNDLDILSISLSFSFIYIGMFFHIKSVFGNFLSVLFILTFPAFHYVLFYKTKLKGSNSFIQKSIIFFIILSLISLAFHFAY